jgi:hypothetical protein
MPKISEHAIGEAALEVLALSPGGTATIRELKERIPNHVNLSQEDLKSSQTRNGEQMWEQQVRNLVSHRATEGNIIAEGLATHSPGRLTITQAGQTHVANRKKP